MLQNMFDRCYPGSPQFRLSIIDDHSGQGTSKKKLACKMNYKPADELLVIYLMKITSSK